VTDSEAPGRRRQWVSEAISEHMRPLVDAWDARSEDMLAVLREAGDTRIEVRRAARTIRVAAWLGVLAALLTGASLTFVLERSRDAARQDRERARVEQAAAVQQLIEAGREDRRAIEQLVRERICPTCPPAKPRP
jgi:uncharacterized membrane protein